MAKQQQPVDPLKAKEARQKKIAIGGAVLLVLLLIVQVPKVMKASSRSSAPPPAPPTTVAAPGTTTPAPATATPTPVGSTPGGESGLISQSQPTAALGQVTSFGSFASKDPFAAIPGSTSAPADDGGTSGKNGGGKEPPVKPPAPPTPPTSTSAGTPISSAVIAVNGFKETVVVGANFPAAKPLFHLVSATAHSAKISVAGGALADGAAAVTLKEGQPLTLMNTSDGTRYKIQLYPQGTKVESGGTTTSPASTSTTATPLPATTAVTTSGD